MTTCSTVELRDLQIETRIGTYAPGAPAPEAHSLDLTLWIDPRLVMIEVDDMSQVFDYDPLVAELERLAGDGSYETQERLLTRMARACAAYSQVEALEIALRKSPIRHRTGSLGVRLRLDREALLGLRQASG